ncbi:MAG: hypothetical protein RIC55_10620 [Pirellulaceae bacterium]
MIRFLLLGGVLVFASFITSPIARSEESETSSSAATSQQIADWIGDLESPDFSVRRAASQKLADAGKSAIAALTKSAQSSERETMIRSLELLQRLLASEEEATKAAAREALESVANGGNALAARRASAALNPPKPKEQPAPGGGGIRIGPGGIQGGGGIRIAGANGVRIAGGQIQIGKGSQIITTQVNGAARLVQVVHGDGRQIVIEDDAQRVKVTVLEKDEKGKVVERSAEAKNADALKTKNKALYDVYLQYDKYRKNGVTITGG